MKKAIIIAMFVVVLITIPSGIINNTTTSTIVRQLDNHTSNEIPRITFKPQQAGNDYGTIDVYGPNITSTGTAIPTDWFNVSWRYRVRVNVYETAGIFRTSEPITVYLEFPEGQARVGTIVVYDNTTRKELPYQLWNITYYNASFYKSVTITWVTPLNANENRVFYIYWSDTNVSPSVAPSSDPSKGLNTVYDTNSFYAENRHFSTKLVIGGGVSVSIGGKQVLGENSLAPEPHSYIPSNTTYIWLDSTTMRQTYYGRDNDHIKIIPWFDNTRVIIYGYNASLGTWVLEVNTTVNKYNMLRFPTVGQSPYNLTKVIVSKTATEKHNELNVDIQHS